MPGRVDVRPEKKKAVEAVEKITQKSQSVILTNYNGMTVKQMTDLRRAVRPSGARYMVLKNSVSVKSLPKEDKLLEKISGPIAVLFSEKEVVEPAKQLVDFIAEHEKPQILGGVLDGDFLTEKAIVELSKLPTRQELLTKMVQCCNGPVYGFVNVLAGTMRKLIYALNAIKDLPDRQASKKEKGGEK